MDTSEQTNSLGTPLPKTTSDVPMDTGGPSSVGIKIKDETGISPGQPQTTIITSDVSVKLESNSPLTFAATGPGSIKQESNSNVGTFTTTTWHVLTSRIHCLQC